MSRNLSIIFLTFFLFFPGLAVSLQNDTDQPIHIKSNSFWTNYKTGENVHEGDVKVTQGTSILIANRLTTKKNKEHKLEEAIAYGDNQLAEYRTQPKVGDPIFIAKAKIIKYYPLKSSVILEGDVLVIQGENSFHGPLIIYNMKDQTVVAPASKVGRATIVIEPDKLKT